MSVVSRFFIWGVPMRVQIQRTDCSNIIKHVATGAFALLTLLMCTALSAMAAAHTFGDEAVAGAKATKVESGKFDRRSITLITTYSGSTTSQRSLLDKAIDNKSAESRYDVNNLSEKMRNAITTALTAIPGVVNKDSLLIDAIRKSDVLREVLMSSSNIDSLTARISRQQRRKDVSARTNEKINAPTYDQMKVMLNGTYLLIVSLDSTLGGAKPYFYGTVAVVQLNVDTARKWVDNKYPEPSQVGLKVVAREKIWANDADLDGAISGLTKMSLPGSSNGTEKKPELSSGEKMAKNLANKVYDFLSGLDAFKVRAMFQNSDNGIDAGSREGLYTDMGFKVYEQMIDADGKPYTSYIGFGRVNSIGNNAEDYNNYSTLYPKIGSYDQGMIAVAHEQGPEICVAPALFTGSSELITSIEFNLNLAQYVKVRQLFLTVGYNYGLDAHRSTSLGVTKRFDLGRLAFNVGADYWLSNSVGLNAGLDFQVSADIVAGVKTGFRIGMGDIDGIDNPGGLLLGARVGYILPRLF